MRRSESAGVDVEEVLVEGGGFGKSATFSQSEDEGGLDFEGCVIVKREVGAFVLEYAAV